MRIYCCVFKLLSPLRTAAAAYHTNVNLSRVHFDVTNWILFFDFYEFAVEILQIATINLVKPVCLSDSRSSKHELQNDCRLTSSGMLHLIDL